MRAHRRFLDLIRLLLLGWCGLIEAQEGAPNWVLDDTVLVQHAIHRSDVPRNLTREEIADALKHIHGEPLAVRKLKSKDMGLEDGVNIQQYILADAAAAFACNALFAMGFDPRYLETSVLADQVMEMKQYGLSWTRSIDNDAKEVAFQVQETKGRTWKFVSHRYGCISSPAWKWAMAHLPPDANSGTGTVAREAVMTESGWGALNNVSNLRDAPPAVLLFFLSTMADPTAMALAVAHKGMLYEQYCEQCGASRYTGLRGFSMGKALQGLLLGQRMRELGAGRGAMALVPEREGERHEWGLTIHNILNMIAACPPDEDEVRSATTVANSTARYAAKMMNRHYEVRVGDFYYSTGHAYMNARELRFSFTTNYSDPESEHSAELEYADYAWSHLFDAIGAKSFTCQRDSVGTLMFAGMCFATTLDWMRLGLLVLQRGKGPDGRQVIAREVIDELYGYEGYGIAGFYINGWYRLDRLWRGPSMGPVLAAIGVGGQMLVIAPSLELVVVRQSSTSLGEGNGFIDVWNYGQGYLLSFLRTLASQ